MEPQTGDRRRDALGNFNTLPDDMVCRILSLLSPQDIGNLTCASSVFYILCNEEPLWMQLCLEKHDGPLDYKGTWKQTALAKLARDFNLYQKPPRQFQGFSSLFLYRRWYRCHVSLEEFALDNGAVERRNCVLPQEFSASYDGKKPVLFTDLVNDWPAMESWGLDQLIEKCGDADLKVSQPHGKSVPMKLKDFAEYMNVQHDEEPLYIFDPKFGESVPELLNDYKVPTLFSDDLFSVLSETDRPPFRWLVLGPARSGASWHVDPSLTSAWNALLSGRKRWALYPPGKVPPGVTLDIDEDDESVHYDGPNSLQWWLDVYPHLEEVDRPLECTQLPGETIYVPSGWWHCVLNIDASIAVTQNFVNVNNLEIVCMDLAPGYRHRAIARAGVVALEGRTLSQNPDGKMSARQANPIFRNILTYAQPSSKSKPVTFADEDLKDKNTVISVELEDLILGDGKCSGGITNKNLLLALDSLKIHSKESRALPDQKTNGNKMGESMMREWLRKLWVSRPELQHTIWKGACLTLDAGTWLYRINVICNALGIPTPTDEEQLPVGDGTNPVYIAGDYVIKLYIQEAGPAASIDCLGSELSFYALLKESGQSLLDVVPKIVASGILYPDSEDYKAVPWDGIGDCPLVYTKDTVGKKRHRDSILITEGRFRTKWSASPTISTKDEKDPWVQKAKLWPYIVTKRCPGVTLSKVHKEMTDEDVQSLATFLAKQVHFLHTLPLPAVEQAAWDKNCSERSCTLDSSCEEGLRGRDFKEAKYDCTSAFTEDSLAQPRTGTSPTSISAVFSSQSNTDNTHFIQEVPRVWQLFVSFLRKQRTTVHERLRERGSIPDHLLKQVDAYLPKDPVVLIDGAQVHKGVVNISALPVWLHMDLMKDNILVEQSSVSSVDRMVNSFDFLSDTRETRPPVSKRDLVIQARYILDYGDLLHGDPLYELLPIHLDIFHLKGSLLEVFLRSYGLPFSSKSPKIGARAVQGTEGGESDCQYKLSYRAMCYCLLHELDTMRAIFKLRQDLRKAESLEEIEYKLWGILNEYSPENYLQRQLI